MNGLSGICKYSRDFYELVLKNKGYIFINSRQHLSEVMSAVSSRDNVHIEIGIFQKKEVEILFAMINSGYRNVSVTLHDAPLIRYPFKEFGNPLLNNLSKFYDKYINRFKAAGPLLQKLKAVYILSNRGAEMMKAKYGLTNIYYLPHIVDPTEMQTSKSNNNNFIFFGFIGRNKGIEYALQLHQLIIKKRPDINFYVVGKAIGKEKRFYNFLKSRYAINVHYMGYLGEDELDNIFRSAKFAIHLFKEYRFFWPFSGSVLYSMKKGKIILTNKVNAMPEIIHDHKNGFFLTGSLRRDYKIVESLINDEELLDTVNQQMVENLVMNHSAATVLKNFNYQN
jgi:glycosyltransferase involved in cell wall biosynthesis